MAKVRLVAYRKATSSSTLDTTYDLDLQEHPVVSLNFQFSDIKEPQSRKASYSQTFKLPFTDNNNEFFQNWFNVNLETLVFSAREKFDAVLYVGTIPQFEGFIQLKSVYQKAQVYEVVLMSNAADLFSVVGENRLKDVFLNDDGSYSSELDHAYNQANIIASWNGGADDFDNTSGTSLRDSSAGVQKVMYPMSIQSPTFNYNVNEPYHLNMTQTYINAQGYANIFDKQTPITMLRPALQLKNIFKLILLKAGFTYTSSFIDGSYFGKLFMTTANAIEGDFLPSTNTTALPAFTTTVANTGEWGSFSVSDESTPGVGVPIPEQDIATIVPADTTSGNSCVDNTQNLWTVSGGNDYFTKSFPNITSISVEHKLNLTNVERVNDNECVRIKVWLEDISNPDITYGEPVYQSICSIGSDWLGSTIDDATEIFEHYFDISSFNMPVGASAYIKMTMQNIQYKASGNIKFGDSFGICNPNYDNQITITAIPYSQGNYNTTINVPACIDTEILQKDFLLDIVQRFNLVIVSDPDDPENLIIEPYNDYLADGEIKHWTDKLDTSKEILVRDTTSLQKKTIDLTYQEDEDLLNKAFKETEPDVNVYGHYKRVDDTNVFATGELKNESIFSPYINQRVFKGDGTADTDLPNMTVQYEYSFNDDNEVENPKTKPKLFYYCGTATTVKSGNDDTITYHMHNQVEVLNEITAYSFTTYPVCTPFDITPSSNAYTLTSANKSLYWNANPPVVGDLNVFNWSTDNGTWFDNTLYGLYWKKYLDSIYDTDARIMECHINLDQVDIYNFKFNDEIFIKDTYWRILEIKNYEVGAKSSTKVVLLKVVDTLIPCVNCSYVVGEDANGNNLYNDYVYYWCPDSNPSCTPDVSGLPMTGILTTQDCCECNGGMSLTNITFATGLYPCVANAGSLPVNLKSMLGLRSILSQGQMKSIIYDKLRSQNKHLVIGSDNGKFQNNILPAYADDMVIKYKTTQKGVPRLQGEMHRIVATGYTEGNTRGYAYPAGTEYSIKPFVPTNSNMIIRITGTATVIGGTSGTYTVGTTEGFSWYTAFKNVNGTITQLSTAGGQQEFSIREGANPTTCTLYITTSNGQLQFGLDDSQTDTKRIWSLTIDLAVQRLPNLAIPYGENWAIFQNGSNIQFMNYDFMLWN